MAAELTTTKLNPDSHLLLDQPLLRLPHELIRRNFKNVQRYVDREREHVVPALKEATNGSMSSGHSQEQTLASIDAMIARMQTLKRKLENLHTEEVVLLDHSAKRIQHLQDLYTIPSLVDVRYDKWSRTRLDRLVVDYLLRTGFTGTATELVKAKDIGHLIDLDTFTSCHKIVASIKRGEVREVLTWVNENRNALKKFGKPPVTTLSNQSAQQISHLEFQIRLQQYIEMIRANTTQKRLEARIHMNKYLIPHTEVNSMAVLTASGLMCHAPDTATGPYETFFSPKRWEMLCDLFIETHHSLLSLPTDPLLHTALTAGLSALKTPACHSVHNPASSATPGHAHIATNTSLCPICSTELNELARSVPYAHHTRSYIENDAVVLPNGRIYSRERLEELQRKILRAQGSLSTTHSTLSSSSSTNNSTNIISEDMIGKDGNATDPTTGEVFAWKDVKKVYIT